MLKKSLFVLLAFVLVAAIAESAIIRVVVVDTSDAAAYVKAVKQGEALLKSKGSPAVIRVLRARFAGEDAGSVVATLEYPNLEALAKDDSRLAADPELRAWVQGLDKLRKVVSDSIYEEIN